MVREDLCFYWIEEEHHGDAINMNINTFLHVSIYRRKYPFRVSFIIAI